MPQPQGLPAPLPDELTQLGHSLAQDVNRAGGRLLLVGGCVRDTFYNSAPSEIDCEVQGLSLSQLKSSLSSKYQCVEVGKAFGVLKLRGLPAELSLPRTETKTGTGHKGFSIEVDPHLPFERSCQRRDFTINAIGYDPLSGELLDPVDGVPDAQNRILRHIGPAFSEDPLRVLRGMQFVARFDLSATAETLELCRTISIENLPAERLFEEWRKLILKGINLTAGLTFLKNSGWLQYFPELQALVGCEQEPEWHPEGDVWVHTLHCMDAFARERIGNDWEDLVVGFAVLCHDLGKPLTTVLGQDGRIRSPLHEPKGEAPTRSFLSRLTNQVDLHEQVVPLVRRHLTPRTFYKDQASDGAIRRLASKVKRIDRLVRVAAADIAGRPPRQDEFPEGPWLLQRAEELKIKDSEPKPILLGRHLIERGMKPGAEFGPLLEKCFDAQLDGTFTDLDSGLAYLNQIIANPSD
jgi:tRNA nucleotidyltransferase (CCA-adding enzyme)